MHRSRLYGVFVDTPLASVPESVSFWSGVFGVPPAVAHEAQFTPLSGAVPGVQFAVQGVDDAARYHVDIETDDVDAEVARLTGLGAVEVSRWLDCHVLRAPGGHLLCVIPVHSAPEVFAAGARTWGD